MRVHFDITISESVSISVTDISFANDGTNRKCSVGMTVQAFEKEILLETDSRFSQML